MSSNYTRLRRILIIAACIVIAAIGAVYIRLPKGISSFTVTDKDGEPLGEEISIYAGTDTATGYDIQPASFADRQVTYQVADEEILTVDEDGTIHALKTGETLVTAQTTGGIRQDITVKVESAVKDIEGLETEITLTEGNTQTLEPEVVMAVKGVDAPAVTYKSSDTDIATVEDDGVITAVSPGTSTITVKAGPVKKKVNVTVNQRVIVYTPAPSAPAARSTTKSGSGSKSSGSGSSSSSDDNGGWE